MLTTNTKVGTQSVHSFLIYFSEKLEIKLCHNSFDLNVVANATSLF